MERRLSAILAADVVGYSRLMGEDEVGTHAALKAHRTEVIEPKAAQYGGRTIRLMGDGILLEFTSVVDAVGFAVAVQCEMLGRNDGVPPARQIHYRVGINIGDVIVDDDDIYGDGVNIAARLESLAEAGGICIGRDVRNQVRDKLDLTFDDLGEIEVKNIARPVHVFRIVMDEKAAALSRSLVSTRRQPVRSRRPVLIAIIGGVALAFGGAALWLQPWANGGRQVAHEIPSDAAKPKKPSIFVLPFSNMSGDVEQDYLADGITDDLITDLSKISALFVIARNTSFTYKGKSVDPQRVAQELSVRYVLEGSIRRSGDEVRINAQLIDTTSGGNVWAERYDGSLADIFALQDQVTRSIAEAMSIALTPREREDLASLGTSNVAAQDAYVRGQSFYLRNTPADNAKAEVHFKRAVELDPGFKRAFLALAKVYYKADPEYAKAMRMDWRMVVFRVYQNLAKSAGSNSADAHVVRSRMALYKHQVGVALSEAELALRLSPNGVDALKARARALIYAGQYAQGREIARRVMRLDPAFPAEPLYLIGLSRFAAGEYAEAADYVEQAVESDPTTSDYLGLLAAAYGKLGRTDEANEAWREHYLNAWRTEPWIAAVVYFYPFQDSEVLRHLADGFEAAGATENSLSLRSERPTPRYLKLNRDTRLTGQEIKSLLFGYTIRGVDFFSWRPWVQTRSAQGKLSHSGEPIQTGNSDVTEGESWIDGDRLCERWPRVGDIAVCYMVFSDVDRGDGHYVMVTELGPQRFQVAD